MATTTIKGKDFLLKLSPDNGTSKYTLVCLEGHSYSGKRNKTKRDTQCGAIVSRGEPERTIQVTGVVNTTPAALAAGVGEASLELIQSWFENDTALTMYRQMPVATGDDFKQQGTVYIEELGDDVKVGEYMSFNLTLGVDGNLTIV
jgi:hypothetical protein